MDIILIGFLFIFIGAFILLARGFNAAARAYTKLDEHMFSPPKPTRPVIDGEYRRIK